MDDLTPTFLETVHKQFEESFYFSCVAVFESQFPESWLTPHIHGPLCEIISDPANTRCAVILPRDWLKSQVCSVYYPVWRAMLNENFTTLLIQNTFTNATKKLMGIRSILRANKLLQTLFPERMLNTSCIVSAEAICLPRSVPLTNSTFEAAGVGTDVTGRHVDLTVEDDTIAPEFDQMTGDVYEPSAAQVEKAIGFHRSLHFLLQDLERSQRIVVGTRWRERDLFSWMKAEGLPYKFIERAVRENALGQPDPDGELTYPERFGEAVLAEIYKTVGDYMYNALMMSTPLVGKDAVFKGNDLLPYEVSPPNLITFTTVDPASYDQRGADPDYNVIITTGVSLSHGGIYVLDYYRERCTPGDLIEELFSQVERYRPVKVGIETFSYQKTLKWWIQELQNKRHIWFNIEELGSNKISKLARIRGLQPVVANKQIRILPWMTHIRQEFVAFPRGAHDDIIDALSYQLSFWEHTEELIEEDKDHVSERFTGAHVLEELRARTGRPKGYPFDVMGVTEEGKDLWEEEKRGPLTEAFTVGGGMNFSGHYV